MKIAVSSVKMKAWTKATSTSSTMMKSARVSDTGTTAQPNSGLIDASSGMSSKSVAITMWPASMFAKRRIISAKGFVNMPRISIGHHDRQEPERQAGRHEVAEVADEAVLPDAGHLLGHERDGGESQGHREVARRDGGKREEAQQGGDEDEGEETEKQRREAAPVFADHLHRDIVPYEQHQDLDERREAVRGPIAVAAQRQAGDDQNDEPGEHEEHQVPRGQTEERTVEDLVKQDRRDVERACGRLGNPSRHGPSRAYHSSAFFFAPGGLRLNRYSVRSWSSW